jgi:hypothetical protein
MGIVPPERRAPPLFRTMVGRPCLANRAEVGCLGHLAGAARHTLRRSPAGNGGRPRRFSPVRPPAGACDTAARLASRRHPPRRTHAEQDAREEAGKKATKAQPKTGGGGKANALQKPLQPVGGAGRGGRRPGAPAPGEAVSKVWDYIKARNLQNPEDRREILADDTLRKVFGKDKVTMFEMNKHLARHLK